MIGNMVFHIILGLLGTEIFTISVVGILYCLAFITFTQACEIYRLHGDEFSRLKKENLEQNTKETQKELKQLYVKLFKTYAENFLLHFCIVMFASEVGRMGGL